jgi:hypothetical protein
VDFYVSTRIRLSHWRTPINVFKVTKKSIYVKAIEHLYNLHPKYFNYTFVTNIRKTSLRNLDYYPPKSWILGPPRSKYYSYIELKQMNLIGLYQPNEKQCFTYA